MTNHQQAREAAADLAYPDANWQNWSHTGGWGKRIQAERLAAQRKGKGHALAGWRQWTIDDSRRTIADTKPTIYTCPHCGELFEKTRSYQKYCSVRCQMYAGNERNRDRNR
jgi:hypothetical protein